jgi:hypothetical protein
MLGSDGRPATSPPRVFPAETMTWLLAADVLANSRSVAKSRDRLTLGDYPGGGPGANDICALIL